MTVCRCDCKILEPTNQFQHFFRNIAYDDGAILHVIPFSYYGYKRTTEGKIFASARSVGSTNRERGRSFGRKL